jgi:hypothetical protein
MPRRDATKGPNVVKALERREIDSKFSAMAGDAAYQKEARLICEEFSQSNWEALQMHEKEARED